MKKYDAVIIGSGLGGLECGYILAKNGLSVCVLEQHHQLGGCLQTFTRGQTTFDTGFHFVGGLKEGQPLHTLFSYFDLLGLSWHQLDEEAFAQVYIGDKSWMIPSGFDRYADYLSSQFPKERKHVTDFADFLKQVSDHTLDAFSDPQNNPNALLMERSAYRFLNEKFDDPLLKSVISGASFSMDLCAETLPLYVFAQINSSFIQSTWKLKGGGSLLVERLADNIRKMGGTVLTSTKVTKLIERGGRIRSVVINDLEQIDCNNVISDIHPAITMDLLDENSSIRPIYKKRLRKLENSRGIFTVHLQLKNGSVPYQNRNIFVHPNEDIWLIKPTENSSDSMLVNYKVPEDDSPFVENIDLLTFINWDEISKWENSFIGRRGADYQEYKIRKAEKMIEIAQQKIPELRGNIKKYFTSTPLTYRDYTGSWQGSAFGIQKNFEHLMFTMLTPKTQIENLLLTGQNLNLHGILGVSMTSLFTCAHLIGKENIN
ncbi:NAD(P)/FAD-dependent oxidoreductase [Bacteroidales bacterium OttesenSCG-928-B11]|nr:NAD(P)/FAD-dependent oxidoreductase [Bacteroidales bacterium OttesenSCG-928-C03]MDL2311699.1 NAD(P)/FAD-dependent oxidoreductase [Bacteroidales bacterium OttesenSCG-928-B11]MDL2325892.1 NAD(P)/FAD-dependent oxidoreductase [Bacteroidales bacterium OttesenSCG-928-A14]